MAEIDQNLQTVGDDSVGFLTLHVADHADPAGIVLETRIIKSPRLRSVGQMFWQEYQKKVKHFFSLFFRQHSPGPDRTGFFEVY